jgi:hypothetical protein
LFTAQFMAPTHNSSPVLRFFFVHRHLTSSNFGCTSCAEHPPRSRSHSPEAHSRRKAGLLQFVSPCSSFLIPLAIAEHLYSLSVPLSGR